MIRIIQITEQHIEGFHKCLDTVARERKYLVFLQAPPITRTREFVLSNISTGNVQIVAVDDEEVIGWCDILPRQFVGFTHVGTLGMGVLPAYRRQGIGERLIREALRRAWEQGIERIELDVYSSNQSAIALYEKVGFEVEGIKRRARKLDGVYDDIVCMALMR